MYFKKGYGQHFLKFTPNSLKRIVKNFTLQEGSATIIIETGPGGGILTYYILNTLRNKMQNFLDYVNDADRSSSKMSQQFMPRIIYRAIEVDKELILNWQSDLIDFQIIYADILQISINDLVLQLIYKNNLQDFNKINIFLFGALPYNISKRIVLKQAYEFCLLNQKITPLCQGGDKRGADHKIYDFSATSLNGIFWYMLQREVTDSFLSKPPNASFIGNYLKLYVKNLQLGEVLSANKFYPKPKVESASIYGVYKSVSDFTNSHDCDNKQKIINCMRKFFIYKRKTIKKNLKILKVKNLEKINYVLKEDIFILNKRPQELRLQDWQVLCNSIDKLL